jgi:dTMP kinase
VAPFFIVVEGPEGAGKTTLVAGLAARMRDAGRQVLEVREPGGTDTAEAARDLVLDPDRAWTPAAELFLILTARAELVERVIRPHLEEGGWVVISDRFDLSTVAYQVAGRGLEREAVLAANRLATGGLRPDVTLVLDLDPAEGRRRQQAEGKRPDRMELEEPAMHDRVGQAFREASGPGIIHLDATLEPDALADVAWNTVRERLAGTP